MAIVAWTSCVGSALAERYRYVSINVPYSVETKAIVVNDSRKIAGSYRRPGGKPRLFTFADGTFKTFGPPPPVQGDSIVPTAIGPTGLVAGVYGDKARFPFLLRPAANAVENIGYPDGLHDVTPTAVSHNDKEDIVGYETTAYDGILAFFTQPDEWVEAKVPHASVTTATAYAWDKANKYEIPVGNYVTDRQHGFMGSSTAPIDPPGSANTWLMYLNDDTDLGGYALDSAGNTFGFVRRGTLFTNYRVPETSYTTVTRNLRGQVFGQFRDRFGLTHGFIYADGRYRVVGSSHSELTLTSVADDGSFVGWYRGRDGKVRGYLATCAAVAGQCTP